MVTCVLVVIISSTSRKCGSEGSVKSCLRRRRWLTGVLGSGVWLAAAMISGLLCRAAYLK